MIPPANKPAAKDFGLAPPLVDCVRPDPVVEVPGTPCCVAVTLLNPVTVGLGNSEVCEALESPLLPVDPAPLPAFDVVKAAEFSTVCVPAIDVVTAKALVAIGDVMTSVPAFNHGSITHCDARSLSTYLPFFFVGVRLRT
jgi:hypothetical protein